MTSKIIAQTAIFRLFEEKQTKLKTVTGFLPQNPFNRDEILSLGIPAGEMLTALKSLEKKGLIIYKTINGERCVKPVARSQAEAVLGNVLGSAQVA